MYFATMYYLQSKFCEFLLIPSQGSITSAQWMGGFTALDIAKLLLSYSFSSFYYYSWLIYLFPSMSHLPVSYIHLLGPWWKNIALETYLPRYHICKSIKICISSYYPSWYDPIPYYFWLSLWDDTKYTWEVVTHID